MPFSPANLNALLQTSAFNLWHYRTADTRAVVSAAGYFTPAAASLKPGDLMVLQTVDAMALVPFRSNAVIGTGVTLDGAVGPISLIRAASQGFSFGQAASAVVRTILLAPIAAGILSGSSIPVSASVGVALLVEREHGPADTALPVCGGSARARASRSGWPRPGGPAPSARPPGPSSAR